MILLSPEVVVQGIAIQGELMYRWAFVTPFEYIEHVEF